MHLITFERITNPHKIIKELQTETEFMLWLEEFNIDELKEGLIDFEYYELYEHCVLIQNRIIDISDKLPTL